MAAETTVSVRIMATDEATKALVAVDRQITQTAGRVGQSGQQMALGLQSATRAIASLNTGLLSQLDPTLARAATTMGALVGVTSRFGLGLATIAGGIGIAAAGLGAYVSVLQDAARRQADLNRSVEALDFSGVVSQVRSMRVELEGLDRSPYGRLLSATRTKGALNILDIIAGRPALEQGIEQGRAAAVQLAPQELAIAQKGEALKQLDALRIYVQLGAERAKELLNEEKLAAAYANLNALLTTQLQLERDLIAAQGQRAAAGLAAAGMPAEVIANAYVVMGEQLRTAEGVARNRREALAEQRRLGVANVRARTPSGEPRFAEVDFGYEDLEAVRMYGRQFAGEALQEQRARDVEVYGIEGRRLDLLRQLPTFTRGQQEAQERELSFRRETLLGHAFDVEAKRQPERGDVVEAQRTLMLEEERMLRHRLDVERSVRNEASAGFATELARLEEELNASGERMAQATRQIATSMHQALSDNFFALVTGDFRRLPDVGRQFGQQMVRMLTDELARMVLSPVLGRLRAALTAPGGGGFLAYPSLLPASAFAGGGAAPLNATGASPSQLASLQTAGYQLVQGAGGQTFAVSQPSMPLPSGMFSTGTSSWNQPIFQQQAIPSTAAQIAVYNEAYVAAIEAGATQTQAHAGALAAASSGQTGALTIGQGVGYGAAIVGAGLTAYGIYESGRASGRESDYGMAAGQGALTGAMSGVMIGTMIAPGVGTIIGAVAGLIVGAIVGVAGAGAGEAEMLRAKRRKKRAQVGQEVAQEIADTIQSQDLDLEDVLHHRLLTGQTLGGLMMSIAGHNWAGEYAGDPWLWPAEDASRQLYIRLEGLGIIPEDFMSSYHVESVNELVMAMGPSVAADLVRALLDRTGELFAMRVALEGRETVAGVGPVTLRTYSSLSALAAAGRPGSGETLIVIDTLLKQLDTDPVAAQALLGGLLRIAGDAGIQMVPVTRF